MVFFTENMFTLVVVMCFGVTLYLFKEMSSIGLSPQHSDKSALGRPDQGADLTE